MRYVHLLVGLVFFVLSASLAHAEEITEYSTDLYLEQNGTLQVTETLHYDFGTLPRHGVTRTIPTALPDTASSWFKERYIDVSRVVVTRDGIAAPFTRTHSRTTDQLKIGDASVTISGLHTYKISYTVTGALVRFTDGTAGLYWNAVGVDWQVPIQKSTVTLRSVTGGLKNQMICYSGTFGQSVPCMLVPSSLGLQFSSPIAGLGALTIQQRVDTSVITVTELERVTLFVLYGGSALLLLLIVSSAWYVFKFKHFSHAPVIAEYEPYNDVLPMHAGFLIDGRLDARDITAAVMYLAAQGFIKIERLEKTLLGFDTSDYRLTLVKEYPEASFLDRVSNLLFVGRSTGATITISELKRDRENAGKRYATSINLKKDLHDSLVQQGYFEQPFGPTLVFLSRRVMLPLSLLLFASFHFLPLATSLVPMEYLWVGMIGTLLLWPLLHLFSERRSALGYEAKRKCEGFKLFLSVTGKDRFAFVSDPRNNPDLFVEYLPYAVAFGVEKQWASVFADVVIPQPNWYADNGGATFNALAFTSSLDVFSTDFSRSLRSTSTPVHSSSGSSSSFGGGFSGGGGGGGGGGSW